MRSRLRRFLYVRIIALVLVVGVCAVAGSLTVGSLLFDNYMERAIRASIADSANKLDLYGTLIGYAIEGNRQAGRKALEILAQQYPSRSAALAAELPRLRAEAMELSVDEIYFIGPDGKVFATSFVPDQGLDLFSFGPAVRNLIVEELGSGKEVDQAVAYSFKTGDVNSYQYLGPKGEDYVIEVSSRVRTAVEKVFPGYGYEGFISFVLGLGGEEAETAAVRIEDIVDSSGISIIHEGSSNPFAKARIATFTAMGGERRFRDGATSVVIFPLKASSGEQVNQFFGVLRVDDSYNLRFVLVSALVAILAVAMASSLAYFGSRRAFGNMIIGRVERLAAAMAEVGSGHDVAILGDEYDDELSRIGREAASMVELVKERSRALEASLKQNRELLHELQHRAKNSLAMVSSLISLTRCPDDCPAGGTFENLARRVSAISELYSLLYSSDSFKEVRLDDYCARIITAMAGLTDSASFDTVFEDIVVPAKIAAPAGIILTELVTNALKYGLPEGRAGKITITLTKTAGGAALEVRDDGPGLPSGAHASVSSGTGLTLVRALAAQINGDFMAEGDGGGTRCRVEFPLPEA